MTDEVKHQWVSLQERLGYHFRDPLSLREALTHRSFANEHQNLNSSDNERLEFLGDAVLDLVVGNILHDEFPDCNEGEMTRIRAEVVSEASLAKIARSLTIGEALLLGRGEALSDGRKKPSLLADALEALFGAVFKDGGFDAVTAVLRPLFLPLLSQAEKRTGLDYKSRLQELVQSRQRLLPKYDLVNVSGPDHDKFYNVDVSVDGQVYGHGEGRTKKAAEQSAAQAALAKLEQG